MNADRGWKPPYDTPTENLRALLRRLDAETPTDEISRLARIHFPRWRTTDTRIETIREQVADVHELARLHRWFAEQDEPPTVTLSDERRRCPVDTDGVVHRAEVNAIVAHRLRGRSPRTCENPDGVIDCHGPDGFGYRCPACGQQRRREEAILDALHKVVKRDQLNEAQRLTAATVRGTETESNTETERTDAAEPTDESTETKPQPTSMLRTTSSTDETEDRATDDETRTDHTDEEEQRALDAFASIDGGETA